MVSQRIKDARAHAGYTQAQLAKRLNTSQTNVCDYENRKALPTLERLIDIADACQVSRVWLITGTGDMVTRYSSAAIDIKVDSIKNRIVMARVAADTSYAAINRRSGISLESLRRWELATNVPRVDLLIKYAEAVDCDPAWLILGVGASPLKEAVS